MATTDTAPIAAPPAEQLIAEALAAAPQVAKKIRAAEAQLAEAEALAAELQAESRAPLDPWQDRAALAGQLAERGAVAVQLQAAPQLVEQARAALAAARAELRPVLRRVLAEAGDRLQAEIDQLTPQRDALSRRISALGTERYRLGANRRIALRQLGFDVD